MPERRRFRTWVAVAACTLLPTACAPKPDAPGRYETVAGKYETVAGDPRRDTALATRENEAALAHIDAGKWPDAEAALKRALGADVMYGPAHNNLGRVYFQQGKLYLAAWEFQYAAKLLPGQAEPKNNLGLVAEAGGKLDEAEDWYQQALKVGPESHEVVANLARVRARRGERGPEFRELLERVVARDPRPEWVSWARARLATMPATTPTTMP